MVSPGGEGPLRRHVSALWIGKPLGPFEWLSLASFVARGFEVDLYAYGRPRAVPEGVRWRHAAAIMPETEVFENPREPGTFAAFANRFRYRLLQMRDTVWVDADVLCLAEGLPSSPYIFGWESPGVVNSAVLAAPAQSALLADLVSRAAAMDPSRINWGEMGPRLVTSAVAEHDLTRWVLPQAAFYPVAYQDAWMLFDPRSAEAVASDTGGSLCLHWWNECLRRADPGFLESKPPAGSYMADAFARHDVRFPSNAGVIDDEWVRSVWRRQGQPLPPRHMRMARRLRSALRATAGET